MRQTVDVDVCKKNGEERIMYLTEGDKLSNKLN